MSHKEILTSIYDAVEANQLAEAARMLKTLDFTLLEDMDEEDDTDDKSPMLLEVDGHPALLAFTSEACASQFVDENPDLIGEDGNVPGFVVEGHDLFEHLPKGVGIILNPETEGECLVLSPKIAMQIRRAMKS